MTYNIFHFRPKWDETQDPYREIKSIVSMTFLLPSKVKTSSFWKHTPYNFENILRIMHSTLLSNRPVILKKHCPIHSTRVSLNHIRLTLFEFPSVATVTPCISIQWAMACGSGSCYSQTYIDSKGVSPMSISWSLNPAGVGDATNLKMY